MSLLVRREELEKRVAGWMQRSGEGGVQYSALVPDGGPENPQGAQIQLSLPSPSQWCSLLPPCGQRSRHSLLQTALGSWSQLE